MGRWRLTGDGQEDADGAVFGLRAYRLGEREVREGLLDIKIKVGETPEGYEIFQPRGTLRFPVGKADLTTALLYLNVKIDLSIETCTLEEIAELVRSHPDLVRVMVVKMRYGFTVDGIICEYAEVRFNGALLESACCESEDYVGVRKAINALGIEAMPNTNYLKAASRVVGMTRKHPCSYSAYCRAEGLEPS